MQKEALCVEPLKEGDEGGGWYFVPWQDMYEQGNSQEDLPDLSFLTVTSYAIVFCSGMDMEDDRTLSFYESMKRFLEEDVSLKEQEEVSGNVPVGLTMISCHEYLYFREMEVAVPGSSLPSSWKEMCGGKMLHICLVPDRGEVTCFWTAPPGRPGYAE